MKNILRISILLTLVIMISQACANDKDLSDAYGSFEAVDVMVAAESAGKLLSFTLEEGEKIEAGKAVGIIDTMQLYLKKQQLYAGIRTINTKYGTLEAQKSAYNVQLENLERELERVESLLEDGAATGKQKDDIQGNKKVINAQLAALETQKSTIAAERAGMNTQIDQLNDQISRGIIKNPITGVVLQKYKEAGEIVGPGQNLYKIANLNELILRVYVSGKQLSSVKIGEQLTVRIDGPEGIEELQGKVSWVSSEAEFTPKIIQTREERINLVYAVKVIVKNDGRLKIGMPGEIKF